MSVAVIGIVQGLAFSFHAERFAVI